MQCWCGNSNLLPFGEGYLRCPHCETLVASTRRSDFNPRVQNESADLYGRQYWFAHQTADLKCPDILARSRSDLAERCVHWLRFLLRFRLPPAKVFEIGCAHGGFVAMLRQAGFDASGLELSPDIVRLAKETFDIPILTGPIEDQSIPAHSLDAIVMMDVLEHLSDPQSTLRGCIELLKPDGILLVQTPCYPEKTTLLQLHQRRHKFPEMLDKNEHPLLFSMSSARELFRRAGAPHLEFIPAIFDFYDMSFIAGPAPLRKYDASAQSAALSRTVNGRMIQALLDLDDRRLNLLAKYRELRTPTPDNTSRISLKSADVA
jgi:2-polyprenyl-3-methyl-5-hydroxy-6-metoxy-1,4-benzoquinol methylase